MRVWLLPVHQTYRCDFRGGFVPNNGSIGENGAEPSDLAQAWPTARVGQAWAKSKETSTSSGFPERHSSVIAPAGHH